MIKKGSEIKEIKPGDLLRPFRNSNVHNYTIGEVYRVLDKLPLAGGSLIVENNTYVWCESLDGKFLGNGLLVHDCELLVTNNRLEDIKREITQFKTRLRELESKLAWMKEVGASEFNVDEYRIWQALSVIDDKNLSKVDKMKLIVGLLK